MSAFGGKADIARTCLNVRLSADGAVAEDRSAMALAPKPSALVYLGNNDKDRSTPGGKWFWKLPQGEN